MDGRGLEVSLYILSSLTLMRIGQRTDSDLCMKRVVKGRRDALEGAEGRPCAELGG